MSKALDDLRRTLDKLDTHGSGYVSVGEAADAIIAALPRRVLPLEWGIAHDNGTLGLAIISDTPIGRYVVEWWSGNEAILITPNSQPKSASGKEAAKTAAQAHYTAQIMAAFGIDAAAMKEGKDA